MSASAGRSGNAAKRLVADAAARAPWLVDAYRAARNPRWTYDIARDVSETRRSSKFLDALPATPSDAPVALVALYRDNIFDTKVACVLAVALRLHGLRPVVSIPTNRASRVRRYVDAYRLGEVIAQDQLVVSPAAAAECADAAARLLDGPIDFAGIKDWEFRGQAVGNHVLSTLIRTTFDGSPDLAIGENRTRVAAILDEVLLNTLRAEQVIDGLEPRVLLVEEANYSTNGPMVDVAVDRGVDVIQTINLWRDDALMSKRLTKASRRVDAKSVAPETLERVHREPWTPERDAELDRDFRARYGGKWTLGRQFQPDNEPRTPEQIRSELDLDPDRRTAVIFAHVLWDASLFYGVDLFENYADWLVQTVGAAVGNDHVNWVIKTHPSNVFRVAHGDIEGESSEVTLIRERFPDLPDHVHLLLPDTKISTLSIYEFADYAVTVRGTPGMEFACFGKPAFTAGTGNYAELGFTVDSQSKEEFLDRLQHIHEYGPIPPEMTRRAREYTQTLMVRRPWKTRSFRLEFDFAERGWHPLDRNVVWTVADLDALEAKGDLTSWAAWAADTADPDYLDFSD